MIKKTRRIQSVFCLIILVISTILVTDVSSDQQEGNNPLLIKMKHVDETTINFVVKIYGYEQSSKILYGDEFGLIGIQDEGFLHNTGQAKIPLIRRMIEIPQDAIPQVTINDLCWDDTSLDELNMPMKIYPVQPPQFKKDKQKNEYTIDEEYYNTNEFMPHNIVTIEEIKEIRGRRFAIIQIAPVQYNPVSGSLKMMTSCGIAVHLSGSNIIKTVENINRYSSTSFEELYESIFINYGFYENMAEGTKDPEGFLIIVDDEFSDEIAPLASWKTTLGFDTTTTETSDIPGGPTAQNIKNYIQNAYDTWTIPPAYVLLVGDTPQIPAFTGSECGTETDSYYGTMDGDIFPDIYISRFPASTETHVTTMVNKTLYYEGGNFPSNDWIKKGAFIASDDQGQMAEDTHDYVINTHLEPNGYTCDRIYEASGGSSQDISDALNDGRSLCIYSGHGSPSGWACIPFYQSDVNDLTNDGMYPFVCSHACSTNTYEDSECFGETWLRAENKGGIAFWGSSCSTYWDEDDVIERRVFDAWWYDGMERIGQMTDKGMYDAYMQNPGLEIEKFMESYNIMGDSSIKIWSDDPFTPDHDIQLESMSIDDIVPHGETQNVTALVKNVGLNAEYGIVVDFIENGIIIDSTTISVLGSMQSRLVSFDWNPLIGTYLIEIESQPIPSEYDLTNNNVNKTVDVIAAPAIEVDPISFSFMVPTDATDTDTLTIFNLPTAEATLEYNITFSGYLNGNWLSANPDAGTINIGQSENVTITVDTTGLNEGVYQGNIIVESNDLNDPEIFIPADLIVVYGNDLAAIAVNNPIGLISHGDHIVNATIQNIGYYDQMNVLVNCSIFEGFLDYSEDFESNNGGYIAGGTTNWEWGNPTTGPLNAYSGSNCWATKLDGDYADDASSTLDSTAIYLPDGISSELSFWHWYNIEDGSYHYDGGNVKISTDGGTYWQILGEYQHPYPIEYASDSNDGIPHEPCFSGSTSGWEYVTFDLSDFAGETVRFRWHFGSDGSVNYDGWYLDDVSVSGNYGRDGNTLVYYSIESIDIDAYDHQCVEFTPAWNADQNSFYSIQIKTHLSNDENSDNDVTVGLVEVFEDVSPPLVSDVSAYPNPQVIDGFVNISCHVSDETTIGDVFVDIVGPAGFVPVNVSMNTCGSDGYYYLENYSVEGNYSFEIYTFDTSGNSIVYGGYGFEIINGSFISVDILLNTGWNLITVPIETSWYATDLIANITDCLMVSWFDAENQTFKTATSSGGYDFPIIPGYGYFVYVTDGSVFTTVGVPVMSVSVPLEIEWNMIGWYHSYDTTASSLMENITGCIMVSWYDNVNGTYKTATSSGGYDFIITQGMGLFVYTTEASLWYGEG